MIPMLAIVVDIPAIKGNAPQIPHPIEPKKNNFQNSLLIWFLFFIISLKKNGNKIIKTVNHLQKAKEIGGTYSAPPRATTRFDAIKIGWTNKSESAKRLLVLFVLVHPLSIANLVMIG